MCGLTPATVEVAGAAKASAWSRAVAQAVKSGDATATGSMTAVVSVACEAPSRDAPAVASAATRASMAAIDTSTETAAQAAIGTTAAASVAAAATSRTEGVAVA